MLNHMLVGATTMGSLVVGLFFLCFWNSTRDRFFLYFALSFMIEGINRVYFALRGGLDEDVPVFYLIRLVAYTLILVAILEKNRPYKESR